VIDCEPDLHVAGHENHYDDEPYELVTCHVQVAEAEMENCLKTSCPFEHDNFYLVVPVKSFPWKKPSRNAMSHPTNSSEVIFALF